MQNPTLLLESVFGVAVSMCKELMQSFAWWLCGDILINMIHIITYLLILSILIIIFIRPLSRLQYFWGYVHRVRSHGQGLSVQFKQGDVFAFELHLLSFSCVWAHVLRDVLACMRVCRFKEKLRLKKKKNSAWALCVSWTNH